MVKESDKYKAQYFQIGAFSCMAPLGKLILDVKDMSNEGLNIYLFIHIVASLFLLYVGLILLYRGLKILKIKE